MKKAFAVVLAVLGSFMAAKAGHIAGGELYYQYVGPGSAAGTDRFRITLRLFRECSANGPNVAAMPAEVILGVFRKNSATSYTLHTSRTVGQDDLRTIKITPSAYPCIIPSPDVCYQVGYYTEEIDLPQTTEGYTISFQTCCRSNGILNVQSFTLPGGNVGEGATYVGTIPGTSALGTKTNSSPVFALKDTAVVCGNNSFTLDFGASDPDAGDSLSYSFCSAFNRGDAEGANNIIPSNPPYNNISYTGGFSGSSPLGPNVTINPKTGIISGIAPGQGKYVINVCISEWRDGVRIGEHRKDFTLTVANCQVADASLQPDYITCDGFTMTFQNLTNSSLVQSWYWDFGVGSSTEDTSTQERPTFTFPDTGTYTLKLVVNRGRQCPDSTTAQVKVYPGFFPAFSANGACKGVPYQFLDNTATNYGNVTGWRWNFGDETTNADTSQLQNPQWTYSTTGTKQIRFIVGNTKGCLDTVVQDVVVFDKPPLDMPFKDTLICSIDTLQLAAIGTGNFSWTPGYNILDANTANPLVWPKVTTTYTVNLNDRGCISTDTVRVRVVDFVTLNAPIDTTICLTDTAELRPVTDGLRFEWTPAATLDDPTKKNPLATPVDPVTNYFVTAHIGKCSATDMMTVRTVPYPFADAGQPVTICYDDTTQLNANIVAAAFTWTPANTLINANTLSPLAYPLKTTDYVLTVTDVLGCPKPFRDTVRVTVRPKIFPNAGRDTSVVVGQPLQLLGTGSLLYTWTPATWLNRNDIPNPVATFSSTVDIMTYVMRAYTPEGCEAFDTINIKVFKTAPDIFVPNAFTPGKATNNRFRPADAPGLQKLDFFRVYNRWGQLVFSSGDIKRGWDGTLGGKPQDSGTYVWVIQGTDFTGKRIFKKGTMLLIR